MIALYCLAVTGLLMEYQRSCQREYDESRTPSLAMRERMLEEENRKLDLEIEELLYEHRHLCERNPTGSFVTDELEVKFAKLEEDLRRQGKL